MSRLCSREVPLLLEGYETMLLRLTNLLTLLKTGLLENKFIPNENLRAQPPNLHSSEFRLPPAFWDAHSMRDRGTRMWQRPSAEKRRRRCYAQALNDRGGHDLQYRADEKPHASTRNEDPQLSSRAH
jgi:hypothetical protein